MTQPCQSAAYVIHSRPYRESSRLLECFTRENGRLSLVAQGLKRRYAAHSAAQHLFLPLQISWRAKTGLSRLISAEALGPHRLLSGHGLYTGLYLNELLVRLLAPQDPHPTLFDLYAQQVADLALHGPNENSLRHFEIQLLQQLGFELALEKDAMGAPIQTGLQYYYRFGEGAHAASEDVKACGRGVWIAGDSLLQLALGNTMSTTALSDAKRLIRMALHHVLEGRPLHSRALFKKVLTK